MRSLLVFVPLFAAATIAFSGDSLASASEDTSVAVDGVATLRLHALAPRLERLAQSTDGLVAVSVGDLTSGNAIAINGGVNVPAASTIKIPVMVEVFRQIAAGKFTLSRTVTLLDEDRDDGYGAL